MGWLVVIVHHVDNGRAKLRIQIPLSWSKTNSVSGPGTVVVIPNAPTQIYQLNLIWEPVLTATGANN